MKNINEIISLKICQCQMASDKGKGLKILDLKRVNERPTKYGYVIKIQYLNEILRLIRNNKTMFNYYVTKAPDQNKYPSILVYIDFKMDGKRNQVSFHTPINKADKKLLSLVESGRKTRWNKDLRGSRESCRLLIDHFNLNV